MCDMSQEYKKGYVMGLKTATNHVEWMMKHEESIFKQEVDRGAGMDDYSCDIQDTKIELYKDIINKLYDIVCKNEPGHDKPANSF